MLREALEHPGPAVIQAVVDPNEPPMPGKVNTEQALQVCGSARSRTEGRVGHHQDGARGQGS